MPSVRCMDFLDRKRKPAIPAVVVAFGDEEFLRRQAMLAVRTAIVGEEPSDFVFSEYEGDTARLADVRDDLFTPPFLGERRLVLVEDADRFVTQFREPLLEVVRNPSPSGVLMLDVRTWTASTKLAKAVEAGGLAIECKAPQAWHAPGWCVEWCVGRHGKRLAKPAAEWLVELVGPNLGLLDQELAKLAAFAGANEEIALDDVRRLVAGTRTESVFRLLDAALDGELSAALDPLDRLLLAGEQPVGLVAVLGAQLRRLTRAAREHLAGKPLDAALRDAGVPPFAVQKSAAQLRHLGRERLRRMYRTLLKADLDMRGEGALPPRTILERLLAEVARGEKKTGAPVSGGRSARERS